MLAWQAAYSEAHEPRTAFKLQAWHVAKAADVVVVCVVVVVLVVAGAVGAVLGCVEDVDVVVAAVLVTVLVEVLEVVVEVVCVVVALPAVVLGNVYVEGGVVEKVGGGWGLALLAVRATA